MIQITCLFTLLQAQHKMPRLYCKSWLGAISHTVQGWYVFINLIIADFGEFHPRLPKKSCTKSFSLSPICKLVSSSFLYLSQVGIVFTWRSRWVISSYNQFSCLPCYKVKKYVLVWNGLVLGSFFCRRIFKLFELPMVVRSTQMA